MDTKAIRAWAAGFTDAKAYIPVQPGNSLRIIIKKKDKMVLEWLKGHFGGNVHLQRDGTYTWSICGDTARNFSREILPYVVVKIDKVRQIAEQPLTGLQYKKRSDSIVRVAQESLQVIS